MHLKRKDSIKLKNIRKWMEGKIPVLPELSIHSGLLPKSDGARKACLAQTLLRLLGLHQIGWAAKACLI